MQVTKRVGLAAAVLVALTGCGSAGSSGAPASGHASGASTAYAQVLQRIASEETAAQQRVADAFRTKSLAALHRALKAFQSDQAGLATQLAALMPPADATGANASLAHAFADSAAAVRSLITRTSHSASVADAFYVIQSDRASKQIGRAIGAAIAQLQSLGYLPDQADQ